MPSVSLDSILKQITDCAIRDEKVVLINVTKLSQKGKLVAYADSLAQRCGRDVHILIHPDDWLDIEEELKKYNVPGKWAINSSFIWGVPVWITDPPKRPKPPKSTWLHLRVIDRGGPGKQALEVHDEFGNKLGEVAGLTKATTVVLPHDNPKLTLELNVRETASECR